MDLNALLKEISNFDKNISFKTKSNLTTNLLKSLFIERLSIFNKKHIKNNSIKISTIKIKKTFNINALSYFYKYTYNKNKQLSPDDYINKYYKENVRKIYFEIIKELSLINNPELNDSKKYFFDYLTSHTYSLQSNFFIKKSNLFYQISESVKNLTFNINYSNLYIEKDFIKNYSLQS